MALPSTNQTTHFDASDNDHVMRTGSTKAIDGENVETWEDDAGRNMAFWYNSASSDGPTYKTVTPLMILPCLDFATTEILSLYNLAGAQAQQLANIFAAGAKTLIIAAYIKTVATDSATPYQNERVFADQNDYFGLFIKKTAGIVKALAYNFHGANQVVTVDLAGENQAYVFTVVHDGVNLTLAVDGGTAGSVASGDTDNLGGNPRINGGSAAHSIRIGELVTYNAALTGSDLTDANSYFISKWLSAGGGGAGGNNVSNNASILSRWGF